MRSTVLGGGSFGTAVAVHLASIGHEVVLWDRNPERAAVMNRTRRNPRYLRDVPLPQGLTVVADLAEALADAPLVVPTVPSHAMREVIREVVPHLREDALLCCASKGVEEASLATMADVLTEEAPFHHSTLFSGPTFAAELAGGLPSTVVVAGQPGPARIVADTFHGGALRVYDSHDMVGVCIGGSLKNVIAIATGISDGLGLGLNARAALITRGLAEITRLAVVMGADPATLSGLAGMGDLVLTCTGDLSRNRRVGLALGQGRSLPEILEDLGETAEGVRTARSAAALARRHEVEMPISEVVHAMLDKGLSARDGLRMLMGRDRKHEQEP